MYTENWQNPLSNPLMLMHTHLYKFFPVKNRHTNQYRGLTYLTTDAYSYSFSPSETEIYRIIKTFQFIICMLLPSNLSHTQFQPRYFRWYPFHVKDADLQQLLWAQDQQHLTEHFSQVSSVGEVEIRSSEQHFCQTWGHTSLPYSVVFFFVVVFIDVCCVTMFLGLKESIDEIAHLPIFSPWHARLQFSFKYELRRSLWKSLLILSWQK